MSELIMTKEGKPFETRQAAQLRMGVLKKNKINTQVVKVEGGFALEELDPNVKGKFIPMHESRRMRFPKREGYHRHMINDDPKTNRIQNALNSGYTFVREDIDGRDSRVGDTSRVGKNTSQMVGDSMVAYLMEKPQELYDEQKKPIQDKLDRQMAEIRREKKLSKDGVYGGVTVETGQM
jgi:hypothetical protein